MSKKIFADVSELMSWVGPVTGIQRVNVSIILEQLKRDSSLGLVVYSHMFKKVSKVDTVDFLFRFDERRSVELTSFFLVLKYGVKRTFETFKNAIPIPLRAPLIRLKRKYTSARQSALLFFHRLFKIERVRHPFQSGDCYVILGNSWGKARITDILLELRERAGIRIAHIIFDMIPYVRPEFFESEFALQYAQEMGKVLRASHLIFSISKHTSKDVREFCRNCEIVCPAIEIIRLGDDITHLEITIPVDRLQNRDFILCVGTIEIRKNHRLLIEGWRALRAQLGEKVPLLVLVGRHGWLVDELISELQHDLNLKKDVLWLRDVSDHQVSWLYRNAMFTVYPSLYEGWGLPVAESLALGQICLASNSSSIPEIGGDLVKYFSPVSQEELVKQLLAHIFMTPKERSRLRDQIADNYRQHLWAETAKTIFSLVEKI